MKETELTSELRSCVNWEVDPASQSLSHSLPVPNKPYGFCGRKTPRNKGDRTSRAQSPGAIKSREVELGSHSWMDCLAVVNEECIKSPGEIKSREVELGSHSWMD